MQIRAGTGGEEAGLWAADLLRMYQRYSDKQRWKASVISENTAEAGGFKEVVVQVSPLLLLCWTQCPYGDPAAR